MFWLFDSTELLVDKANEQAMKRTGNSPRTRKKNKLYTQ